MQEYIIFVYRLGNGKMNSRAGFFCVPLTSATFSIYNRTLLRITTVFRLDIFCIVLFVRCHPINKILTRLSYLVNYSYISTQVFFLCTRCSLKTESIFFFLVFNTSMYTKYLSLSESRYTYVYGNPDST